MSLSKEAELIQQVSPSFCLAKWLQVTVDLANGTTHSCHHPKRHQIPLDELEKNPGALHNTNYKKAMRKLMLEGKRPKECGYCWSMEDSGVSYSDRMIKSTDTWAFDQLERIKSLPWDADVNPTYLEVMLDDLCNFSCIYCKADVSSSIAQEMKTYGAYPVLFDRHRFARKSNKEHQEKYVQAFWKWLPEVLPGLKFFRITGGEPLISPRFTEVIQFLKKQQNPDLVLSINTHLGHSESRLQEFLEKMWQLKEGGHVKAVEIYTSADAQGAQAEYIRHGLNYQRLLTNIGLSAASPAIDQVVVMSTYNLLSMGSFTGLLQDLLVLKQSHPKALIDTSFLRSPLYLCADLATNDLIEKLDSSVKFMKDNASYFNDHEIQKVANLQVRLLLKLDSKTLKQRRLDFFLFSLEYDRRKGKRFILSFPEYHHFYLECKMSYMTEGDDLKSTYRTLGLIP